MEKLDARLLIVDDDRDVLLAAKLFLKQHIKIVHAEEKPENIQKAISTIQSRSQGLLNFVEIYRNLTRIPKPSFKYFPVSEAFERSGQLLKPKMDELNIKYSSEVFPPDLMITADPDLVDQVVINMILNAIHAVKETGNPEISILATLNNNSRVIVDFKDTIRSHICKVN